MTKPLTELSARGFALYKGSCELCFCLIYLTETGMPS